MVFPFFTFANLIVLYPYSFYDYQKIPSALSEYIYLMTTICRPTKINSMVFNKTMLFENLMMFFLSLSKYKLLIVKNF